ncbi:MAG: hypothetical protein ACREQ2_15515 [Candidatus Binatia bacterium]
MSILRGLFAYDKSDPPFLGRWLRHELPDRFDNYLNLLVVLAHLCLGTGRNLRPIP